MDSPSSSDTSPAEEITGPVHAVLAEVTCTWILLPGDDSDDPPNLEPVIAVILHAANDMFVLERSSTLEALPPVGTLVHVSGETLKVTGRLVEAGRGGRFLVSVGSRPVRTSVRLRVSLRASLRCPSLPEPLQVEIVDLTTSGARVRGVDLPVDTQLTLDFTPPGREESVSVRARVAHVSNGTGKPWIGVIFRLVALRGGR